MIKNLGHVGLGVSNMERSLEFYRDFLGMEILVELDVTDDRIGRVIGVQNAKCKIAHLQLGDAVLELFEYSNQAGKNIANNTNQYDYGLIHIGFEVDDFHTHIKHLKERNITFLGEPVEFRPDVWVVYFYGPDGEVVEFRQQPE